MPKKTAKPTNYVEASSAHVVLPDMREAIEIVVPVKIVSEANAREHWRLVNKRKKQQAQAWWACCMRSPAVTWKPPYYVVMTRLGPKTLDDDNLAGGFKKLRDCIAESLAVNDGDVPNVSWHCKQEKSSAYGAKVLITTPPLNRPRGQG